MGCLCLNLDIYVLSSSRSYKKIMSFLEEFLPYNIENASEYYIPYLSDNPEKTFTEVHTFMQYMETAEKEPNAIYWNNLEKDSDIEFATVFYTDDAKMVLGLSLKESGEEKKLLKNLIILNILMEF